MLKGPYLLIISTRLGYLKISNFQMFILCAKNRLQESIFPPNIVSKPNYSLHCISFFKTHLLGLIRDTLQWVNITKFGPEKQYIYAREGYKRGVNEEGVEFQVNFLVKIQNMWGNPIISM